MGFSCEFQITLARKTNTNKLAQQRLISFISLFTAKAFKTEEFKDTLDSASTDVVYSWGDVANMIISKKDDTCYEVTWNSNYISQLEDCFDLSGILISIKLFLMEIILFYIILYYL